MQSGPQTPGDVLQVLPRRASSSASIEGSGTGSLRIQLQPERRRKLKQVVIATVTVCGLILIAAGIARLARASGDSPQDRAVTPSSAPIFAPPAPSAPSDAPPVPAADPAPPTGTLRLQRPAIPGLVWLDGAKVTSLSAAMPCGAHEVQVGARGKPHTIDIPCGGELRLSR